MKSFSHIKFWRLFGVYENAEAIGVLGAKLYGLGFGGVNPSAQNVCIFCKNNLFNAYFSKDYYSHENRM